MGFMTLALILSCLLFWGVIIMLITHSAWLATVLQFIFAIIIAFVAMFLILYVIRKITIYVVGNKKNPEEDSADSAKSHTILDPKSNQCRK